MNNVTLVGRLTKDPELRYTSGENSTAVANFTVAINRQGKEDKADFPRCIAFGKTAEFVDRYFHKGKLIGLTGRIQTGSYKREDGSTVWATDVIAERVEFIGGKSEDDAKRAAGQSRGESAIPQGFAEMDDDMPF